MCEEPFIIIKQSYIDFGMTPAEAMLYALIEGYGEKCEITNKYLAYRIGVSERQISNLLGALEGKKLVLVERDNGNRNKYTATMPKDPRKNFTAEKISPPKKLHTSPENISVVTPENISPHIVKSNNNISSKDTIVNAETSSAVEKKKKTKQKKESDPSFNKCKEIFLKIYEERTAIKYYFIPKDAKALKELLNKIKFLSANASENYNLEDNFFAFIAKAYETSTPWLKENFSLPIINSKFNEIYNAIKNGRQSTDNSRPNGQRNANAGISRDFLSSLAEDCAM